MIEIFLSARLLCAPIFTQCAHISIGTPNTPTPIGTYRVLAKQPYAQSQSGYALVLNQHGISIHSTLKTDSRIGENVSAGCVRVSPADFKSLLNYVEQNPHVLIQIKG